MKKHIQKLKSESGVTLVELLAAIAILAIIVTAFLAFFVQAGNTNKMTTNVNEATFLAQEEMERTTRLASESKVELGEMTHIENGYTIHRHIKEKDDYGLHPVVVTVTEGGKTRAKMEKRLSFVEKIDPENED